MKTFFIEQNIKKGLRSFKKENNKIIITSDLSKKGYKFKANLIKKILRNINCKQVVVDKNLKKDTEFINLLYGCDINICNKDWLFRRLVNEILEQILEKQDLKKENVDLYICVNDVTFLIEDYIYKFVKEFKRLTIVTNHIGIFKKIETKIYEEDGILVNITNNRSKTLTKAQFIINFDFPKELFNEFNVYDRSIIIDLEGSLCIRRNFLGKFINDFSVNFDEDELILDFIAENKLENYDIEDVCQAFEIIPKCIDLDV